MPDTKKAPPAEDTAADDPWESFTPDEMMDGVAERLWTKMGAKPDGPDDPEPDDPDDGGGGGGDTGEHAPKATNRGQKFSDWFFGGIK